MDLRQARTIKERREALEKELRVKLAHIGVFSLDEKAASTKNCENMIGAAQIPMGVVGPLKVKSMNGERLLTNNYYIPLATTEGALVASVNRGCKAITESGGVTVDSYRAGATRGPVFRVQNVIESKRLCCFLEDHIDDLKRVAEQTSHHIQLEKISSIGVGRYHFVRFGFDTQDAMGMNMVTIATDAIASYIQEQTGISCLSLSGNYCVDKKPSWQNVINNRGIVVWAEATITKNVLTNVLKTSAKKVYDVWLGKCMIGSAMSGSMAFNAQFANIVAALFAATGQDIAHVVEGSLGVTTAEVVEENLYISVYLPDLMVGTVGGGTGLATQKEALSLLGVVGGDDGKNAQRLAELIGATVLAGELSLLSSLEEGSLAKAHQRLGRGKTV